MNKKSYYIAFLLPWAIIILLLQLGFTTAFAISLLLYYIYRCFLDYYRLNSNGKVDKKDIWKFILPVWSFIYFRELYFE